MRTRRQRVEVESPPTPSAAATTMAGPSSPTYSPPLAASPDYRPQSPDYRPPPLSEHGRPLQSPDYRPPPLSDHGRPLQSPDYRPPKSPQSQRSGVQQPVYRPRTPPMAMSHPNYGPPGPPPGPPPSHRHPYTAGRQGAGGRRNNRGSGNHRVGIPQTLAAQLLAWIPPHVWHQQGMHPPLPFGAEHEYLGGLPPRP